jgi:Bacterial Ig-like domain (group 3)/FG-GAP-like repeat/FG-GAP repeat
MRASEVLWSKLPRLLVLSALLMGTIVLACCEDDETSTNWKKKCDNILGVNQCSIDNYNPDPRQLPLFEKLLFYYDPAPAIRPFLLREHDFSLTRFMLDATGNLVSMTPNYQDSLHQMSGLSTTPDQFGSGFKDPTIGIMSQQAFSLGKLTNGNIAGGIISVDGVKVTVVNGSTFSVSSQTDYPSIPSPNPDSLFPQAVTAADLNGDGNIDVIVVNSGTGNPAGTVTIFPGNGDGTLKTPATISVPIVPFAVIVEDVNNDGKLDLVILGDQPSFASGAVATMLGNGDGTFQAPILGPSLASFQSGSAAGVIADFNNDGKKDIAISMGQILLGNGDGTFTLLPQLAFQSPNGIVNGLAAGDLNHDGKIDLAISNPLSESVDVYLGNGDGTLTLKTSYATMFGAQTLTIADLDGDGNPDIFVGAAQGGVFGEDQNTLGVFQSLMGKGDGTFVAAANYSASPAFGANAAEFGSGFDVADFNSDGTPDIVRIDANSSNAPVLSVLTGQSNGSFQPGPQTAITLAGAFEGLVAADVNRDSKSDVVFASSDTVGNNGGSIGVVFGKGDGTFQTQANYVIPGVITSLVLTDVNGDGFPDLVAATGFWQPYTGAATTAQLFLLLNNRDGTFQSPKLIDTKPYLFQVAAKDVNGDGHTDLVVTAGGIIPSNTAGTAFLYLGNGDGTFKTATQLNISGSSFPAGVAIADINSDGKPDVVLTDFQTGNLLVLLGNGDGTFQNPIVTQTQNRELSSIGIADLHGQGTPDVILSGFVAAVLQGNGNGTFTPPFALFPGGQSNSVKLVDVNADDHPDILISSGPAGLHVMLSEAALAGTTTTVTSSMNPAKAGQSVTFTATVTSTTAGTPTGAITFLDGSISLGTTTLNGSAQASLSMSSLSVGMHSITAAYGGDATFAASTSAVLTQTVTSTALAPTTTTLTSMPNPSNSGQSVTFTATVSSATAGAPTGEVTFLDGATSLGTGTLNGSAQVTFSTSALSTGMHSITASYGGDANFAASTSTALTQSVNGAPDFSVNANPGISSITAGQSTAYTLALTPSNGFNQTVTLTCSGAPVESTCTPGNPTVTLNGTSASMVQFNVTTSPRGTALLPGPTRRFRPFPTWPAGALLLLAMMLTVMLYGWQVCPRRLALGLTIAVVSLVIAGCGSNHHGSTATTGTPAGTYTLMLTGTAGILTHSSQVTLKVN